MRAFVVIASLAVHLAGMAGAQQPVTRADGLGIVEAYFAEDADVYPHRVLGDIREKLALSARDHEGRFHNVRLYLRGNRRTVFEDIAPRLADVTGDGLNDIVVVESDPQKGASLAVYGLQQGRLTKVYPAAYWLALSLARARRHCRSQRGRDHRYRLCRDAAFGQDPPGLELV